MTWGRTYLWIAILIFAAAASVVARWSRLKEQARQSTIGQVVDEAMAGIERDNSALKDVLPKDYAPTGQAAAVYLISEQL